MKGGISVDWNVIKAEYIAGGTTYEELAEKYGVSISTLKKKATREHWVELRNQTGTEMEQKMSDAISDQQSEAVVSAVQLIDQASISILKQIATEATKGLSTYQMDVYSRAIKTLRGVLGIKSDADSREQEARIASLNRQAEKGDKTDTTINIIMGDGGEDYSV